MKKAMIGVLLAAPMMLVGQIADAGPKPSDQSRSSSTYNVVMADFRSESEGQYTHGHVEAYETASGAFVGYFDMNGGGVCNDNGTPEDPNDDFYYDFWFQTQDEGGDPYPADVFTIGKRNSTARVEGNVRVNFQFNVPEECGGGDGGEMEIYVVIDLESNGLRIRDTQFNSAAGPDFSSRDRYTFSGSGGFGFVDLFYGEGVEMTFDADGRMGTAKSTNSNRTK